MTSSAPLIPSARYFIPFHPSFVISLDRLLPGVVFECFLNLLTAVSPLLLLRSLLPPPACLIQVLLIEPAGRFSSSLIRVAQSI